MPFPPEIESAVREAAVRLGRALDVLEWPNGETNNAPNEINALINLQGRLAGFDPPFHFYSEAGIRTGRVDMIASDGTTSLAMEAKSFGNINPQSDSIARDLKRLRTYTPAYYRGNGAREINDWWGKSHRWALIIITSFRGDEVRNAWVTDDDDLARREMETYESTVDRPREDGTGFMALRATPGLYRFAAPITMSDRWKGTGPGHFLCGALELSAQDDATSAAHAAQHP